MSPIINDDEKKLFNPLNYEDIKAGTKLKADNITFWGDVWRRFRRNKPAFIGTVIIIIFIIFAIIGPLIVPYTYSKVDLFNNYKNPGR